MRRERRVRRVRRVRRERTEREQKESDGKKLIFIFIFFFEDDSRSQVCQSPYHLLIPFLNPLPQGLLIFGPIASKKSLRICLHQRYGKERIRWGRDVGGKRRGREV